VKAATERDTPPRKGVNVLVIIRILIESALCGLPAVGSTATFVASQRSSHFLKFLSGDFAAGVAFLQDFERGFVGRRIVRVARTEISREEIDHAPDDDQ
jgi:hypothetical protein